MDPTPSTTAAEQPGDLENAFEAERARTIARNRKILESMGVVQAAAKLHCLTAPEQHAKTKYSNRKRTQHMEAADARTRASRRIRGMAVDNDASAAEATASTAASSAAAPEATVAAQEGTSSTAAAGLKQPRFQLTETQYTTPFTLVSIGVTVWELGQLHRGAWQQQYWSSRGCLFRHAYPVGYVASKVVFGHTWKMTISTGECGPVFTVCDEGRGISFSGCSPTKPWTDVCLAHRTGQRISGPKYFGFSDVLLQRAIA